MIINQFITLETKQHLDSKFGDKNDDEDNEDEEVSQRTDPADSALPTFLLAGTIFGSVFKVDLTKVKVDVETNDLSMQYNFKNENILDNFDMFQFVESIGILVCMMDQSNKCHVRLICHI